MNPEEGEATPRPRDLELESIFAVALAGLAVGQEAGLGDRSRAGIAKAMDPGNLADGRAPNVAEIRPKGTFEDEEKLRPQDVQIENALGPGQKDAVECGGL